jgi:hypothetical protein
VEVRELGKRISAQRYSSILTIRFLTLFPCHRAFQLGSRTR